MAYIDLNSDTPEIGGTFDNGSGGVGGTYRPPTQNYPNRRYMAPPDDGGYTPTMPTPTVTGAPTGTTTPAPTPPKTPFSLGAFRTAFDQATAGKRGTLEEFISTVFPALQQQFPDIQRFGSKGDKIRLPDGTVVDAVLSAGTGGRGYTFGIDTGPGSFFSDPIGEWFSSLVGGMIDQLGQPREMPGQVNDSYNILKQLATSGGNAPDLSELQNLTRQRVGELQQEPFSATEEAAQRVKAFDNLERSRANAIQQVRERMVAQGHAPSSGTVEAAIQQVNQSFDSLRAGNENQLLLHNIDERQRRKSEAVTIEQQLADRINNAAQIAEQGRSRSVGAAAQLAQLAQYIGNFNDPMSRIGMILQAAGLIPALESSRFKDAQQQATGE